MYVAGYYLSLKSVRSVYRFDRWRGVDETAGLFFILVLTAVILFFNSYENRVAIFSICIAFFSAMIGLIAYSSWLSEKQIGTALLLICVFFNATVATARAVAALQLENEYFRLMFWDPLFFAWSYTAVFLFALAQFINGNYRVQEEVKQRLFESQQDLSEKQALTVELATTIEEQKNLQKLLLHELKRPLSAIHVMLQNASSRVGHLDQERIERLLQLNHQATTYLENISQYQDIAEMFKDPHWDEVSVAAVAQDIKTKWGITVFVTEAAQNRLIICDALLIDIAVGNLVDNAQKFCDRRESVQARLGMASDQLQIDIQDDGAGIAEADQHKVWEKFLKLSGPYHAAPTGSGLGLYIVGQIANLHGGRAYVVSRAPSTVRLELPLAKRGT